MSKPAVDVHVGPVCAGAEVAGCQDTLYYPVCAVSALLATEHIAFGCSGYGCSAEVVSFGGGLCHTAVLSPQVTLHPPRGHLAGS